MRKFIKRILKPIYYFFLFLLNRFFVYLPCYPLRFLIFKLYGVKLFLSSKIDMNNYFLAPYKLKIGKNVHINQGCLIDARGEIQIKNNVSIGHKVNLITGSHDIKDPKFSAIFKPIIIEENCFIGSVVTILQGVTVKEGCIICAGALLTKDTEPFSIYAGIPAKKIGDRIKDINIKINPDTFFC